MEYQEDEEHIFRPVQEAVQKILPLKCDSLHTK